MSRNEYSFHSQWCFEAEIEEVMAILLDVGSAVRWWAPICRRSDVLEPGDEWGIGRRCSISTRATLPYTLDWELLITDVVPDERIAFQILGQAVGHAEWRFQSSGRLTIAELEWSMRVEHPIVKRFSGLFRPIFHLNHCHAMAEGQRCLCAEIKRRGQLREAAHGVH